MKYGKSALIDSLSGIFSGKWTRKNLRDLVDSLYTEPKIIGNTQADRITGFLIRNIDIKFERPFSGKPIGVNSPRLYRMVSEDGAYHAQDVLFTYPSVNWLTATGFQITIHESEEELYNVILEYVFVSPPNFAALEVSVSETNLADMNLSSANIDERLNWHAAAGTTGQIFHLYGNEPRTSASDAAYTALTTTLNNYIITERE
jgi:hypothetical protein